MKPTDEQHEIHEAGAALRPGESLKVIAFAGAGKTTTLKGVASARIDRGIYLAFNKAIATEASAKLAMTKCSASTMHSLAYQTVKELIGSPAQVNARTIQDTGVLRRFRVPTVKGWNDYRISLAVGRTLTAFANSADQEFMIDHAREALISSVGDPDMLRAPDKKAKAKEALDRLTQPLVEMASFVWQDLIENCRMSHDMYLKVLDLDEDLRREAFRGYKYLMIDEAQDINPVQRSIIEKAGVPLIAVGDPYQQIYSWRGAENALALLPGKSLYLTQSFRFGENIAEVARHILAIRPDGGPEQRLEGAGGRLGKWDGAKAAIICRTNMGVLDEAMRVAAAGRSFHVDNLDSLMTDILSAQALHDGDLRNVKSEALKSFDNWEELKLEVQAGDNTLQRLHDIVERDQVGMTQDINRANKPSSKGVDIALCTAHRSKGLEFPAVMLGGDWKDVEKMAKRTEGAKRLSEKDQTLAIEEYNALYVAATRPIQTLRGEDRILFPEIWAEQRMLALEARQAKMAQERRDAADTPEPA